MRFTRNHSGTIAAWGFLVLTLISPVCLAGEDSGAQESEDRFPRLGEHRFTPNTLTGDPFIRTYVRNSLGIGQAVDLFVPVLEIDEEQVIGLKGSLLNAILEFEFQQAVKEWVAFRAQVRILGRLGTGAQSLLAQGVTANMGYEFGWMFRLAQGEKTALSGTLNVWNNQVTKVNLLGFVDGILSGENSPLVSTAPVTRGGGGLRYAWAASELVGFNFLGESGLGESIDRRESDEWFFKGAAAVDFDLRTRTALPLGVVLGYKLDTFPNAGNDLADVAHEAALRIAYTGTTDFLISLDFTYGWYKPVAGKKTFKLASTLINLRYYF